MHPRSDCVQSRFCATLERMGKVINLNRYRKKKAREDRATRSETNRAQHGLTKEERALEARRKEQRDRHVDGHKLDTKE
jgi:hypothetical protein